MVTLCCPYCQAPVPVESPWDAVAIGVVICSACDRASRIEFEESRDGEDDSFRLLAAEEGKAG